MSSRESALEVLLDYERRDAYLNLLLASHLERSHLDRRDRAFVTELVLGTVRMKLALDRAVGQFSTRPLESLDIPVMWLLRMSAYQALYMSVPDHAACGTAVEVARARLRKGAAGYVNGVMRSLLRGRSDILWPDRHGDPRTYMEIALSHPRWIVEMWSRELGTDRALALCEADNVQRPLVLRCNLNRTTCEELAPSLRDQGMEVERGGLAPEALLVKGSGAVPSLQQYKEGLFSVQDEGAMMVGRLVGPEPGMRVLDLCAAPGGKANHMAELMRNSGEVLAVDVSASRLELVAGAARRLGNGMVETRCMDATTSEPEWRGSFDRVLVDAPCSGLGTLGRRPDARWRKSPGDIAGLARLQGLLLQRGSFAVRSGGLLVYSTCTISRKENEEVVELFLSGNPDFAPVPSPRLEDPDCADGHTRVMPDVLGCDGMFAAVMRKVG